MKNIIAFVVVCLFALIKECSCKKYTIERNLKLQKIYHINCTDNNYPIVHITATNTKLENDIIHYIFTTIGRPTALMKHVTDQTVSLTIDKNIICKQNGTGINFHPYNSDISGIMISKVFGYIDSKDTVDLGNTGTIYNDILHEFQWKINGEVTKDSVNFDGTSKRNNQSSISFKLKVHTKYHNTAHLPRNPVSANITEFTLVLDNLNHTEEHIRYATEVIFFSTGDHNSAGNYQTHKYIDDEYTPGIFSIWSVRFPLFGGRQMFTSWKPVAYNKKDRSRETQSLVHNFDSNDQKLSSSGPIPSTKDIDIYTVVNGMKDILYYKMNVTFGISKDGCYTNNPYLAWTGMIGYDKVTTDTISTMVITIITIGVGAPAVVILVGILITLVRKVRLSRKGYEQIN